MNHRKLRCFLGLVLFGALIVDLIHPEPLFAKTDRKATFKTIAKCSLIIAGLVGGTYTGLRFKAEHDLTSFLTKPTDSVTLTADGASVSAGTGASLSLELRMRQHFQAQNVDLGALTGGKKIFISVDPFFPTVFPEIDQSPAVVEARVRMFLEKNLSQFDYVIVGDLFDSRELTEAEREALFLPANKPLKNISDILLANDQRGINVALINRILREEAGRNPRIICASVFNFARPFLAGGYRFPHTTKQHQAVDRFPDGLHPDDAGQASLFNTMLGPPLRKIPGLENRIPEMRDLSRFENFAVVTDSIGVLGVDRLSTSFVEMAVKAQAFSPKDFQNGREGPYWMRYAKGAKLELKSNKTLVVPSLVGDWTQDRTTLRSIQQSIRRNSDWLPEGFIATKRGTRMILNLTQALYYTAIALESDGINYVGYGYDFWYSANKKNPPTVNYQFILMPDPNKPLEFSLRWRVFPLVRDKHGRVIQENVLIRTDKLDGRWVKEIRDRPEQRPYLEFTLPLQVTQP